MRRRLTWCLLVVIVGAGAYARTLLATAAVGFKATTLATATFDEIDLNAHTIPADDWQARLKTHGFSDLYVQSNVWQPNGTTGWHTHPGPSLVIVTSGTITAYDGDDSTCTPHVYSANTTQNNFIDRGDGHVHIVRNEDPAVSATTIAVQLIPQAAIRRIDAPAPGNCPF
jgi:hypothetical protein